MIGAWWNALSVFQQIMVSVAIPSVLIFVVQIILLLFGMGSDMGVETPDSPDFDPSSVGESSFGDIGGLKLLTLRGILGFLATGGWMAYGMAEVGLPNWLSAIIGVVAGCIMAWLIAYIFKISRKLESDGTLQIENAIGRKGMVYIPIPANRTKPGKINMTLQERFCELEAITDEDAPIPTGTQVEVIGKIDEVLIVKPVNWEEKT